MRGGVWNQGNWKGGVWRGKPRILDPSEINDRAAARVARSECTMIETKSVAHAPACVVHVRTPKFKRFEGWGPYQHAQYMVDDEKGDTDQEESQLFTSTHPPQKFVARWEAHGQRSDGRKVSLEHAWSTELLVRKFASETAYFRVMVSPDPRVTDVIWSPTVGESRADRARKFCVEMMAGVELDLGRRIIWAATSHWNTGTPHLHICIRGLGPDGRAIVVSAAYRRIGFENRARATLLKCVLSVAQRRITR